MEDKEFENFCNFNIAKINSFKESAIYSSNINVKIMCDNLILFIKEINNEFNKRYNKEYYEKYYNYIEEQVEHIHHELRYGGVYKIKNEQIKLIKELIKELEESVRQKIKEKNLNTATMYLVQQHIENINDILLNKYGKILAEIKYELHSVYNIEIGFPVYGIWGEEIRTHKTRICIKLEDEKLLDINYIFNDEEVPKYMQRDVIITQNGREWI